MADRDADHRNGSDFKCFRLEFGLAPAHSPQGSPKQNPQLILDFVARWTRSCQRFNIQDRTVGQHIIQIIAVSGTRQIAEQNSGPAQ